MIRNDKEYKESVARLGQQKQHVAAQEAELKAMGLTPEQVKRALDPIRSFRQQIEEEVAEYERLRRGEFDEMVNLHGLGRLLVALRIARGLTQRELAERLGVHETQVSRDERNEYHGIALERAVRILEALGAEVHSQVELAESKEAGVA